MERLKEIAGVIIVVLLVGATLVCQQSMRQSQQVQATAAAAPLTVTPLPIGPLAVSLNPDVVIVDWQYLDPSNTEAWEEFGFSRHPVEPGTIDLGSKTNEAYAHWHEEGFDLIWWDFPCATQPVMVIEGTTVGLWRDDHSFYHCEAEAAPHVFRIEVETTIPQEAWRYEMRQGIPHVTLQTQP